MKTPTPRMKDITNPDALRESPEVTLLRAVIGASGLSARRWAREVAWRDERTVRRWLSGESPIPKPVLQMLREWRPDPIW